MAWADCYHHILFLDDHTNTLTNCAVNWRCVNKEDKIYVNF